MSTLNEAPRRRWGWAALRLLAWVYLAALTTVASLATFVGERWWVAVVLLYLPRVPLLAPLVVFAPLAFVRRYRALFAGQAAFAIAIVLVFAHPRVTLAPRPGGGPSIRLLSYNVWYGRRGMPAIEAEVDASHADVILFQALSGPVGAHFTKKLEGSMYTHASSEFFLASKYPIVDFDLFPARGFARYGLDTPIGMLDVFDVHPPSPRPGLSEIRHQSKRRLIVEGPSAEATREVDANTSQREADIAAIAAAARASTRAVVIAGDTNLPEHSAIFRRHLADWEDGFATVGNGLGYTFPANMPFAWMRIDRILVGRDLAFSSFSVGGSGGSDHRPVWADLERR